MCCSWDLLTRKHFHLSQHLSCHSFIQKYRLCHIFGVIIWIFYIVCFHISFYIPYFLRQYIVFEHLFTSTNSLLSNFESMHCSKTSFDTPKWLYKHTFIWFWFKCIKEYLANFKDSFYLAIFIYLFVIY